MNFFTRQNPFVLIAGLLVSALPAIAAENSNLLSVGAGIASPSVNTAINENPAGLVRNEGPKIVGNLSSPNSSFNPLGISGTFLTGNGRVGGGIGYQNLSGTTTGSGIVFGLGAEATNLGISFGVAGGYNTGAGGAFDWNSFGLNLGMLFNSKGPFRVGIVGYGVTGSALNMGAGFSYDLNPYARLVVDSSFDKNFGAKRAKPALSIAIQDFQMAVGYGIDIDKTGSSAILPDTSLALGYAIGRTVHIQFYYNQIAKYFAGLMIRF